MLKAHFFVLPYELMLVYVFDDVSISCAIFLCCVVVGGAVFMAFWSIKANCHFYNSLPCHRQATIDIHVHIRSHVSQNLTLEIFAMIAEYFHSDLSSMKSRVAGLRMTRHVSTNHRTPNL